MTLRALLTLLFVLAAPLPALAFGDCTTSGYRDMFTGAVFRDAFDDRIAVTATCHSKALDNIEIGGRASAARVLRFDRPFDASDDAWISGLNEVLGRVGFAATAMDSGLRIQPVTIVMTDLEELADDSNPDAPPHTGSTVVHGAASHGRLTTECPVVMYKLQERVSDLHFQQTIAHELFHCIQYQTWPTKVFQANNGWWVEGSAEYFGVLAVPERDSEFQASFGDESQVSGLFQTGGDNDLTYENVAFFSWLHQQGGGPAVGQFLTSLPAGPAPHSLQSVLSLSQWAAFTEDLLEGTITLPGGWGVPKGRTVDIMVVNSDARELTWQTDAFRTVRIGFEVNNPGRYEVSVRGPNGFQSRFRQGEGDWQTFPATLEGCRNSAPALAYAVTTQGPLEYVTTYNKIEDCSPCETAGVLDRCLAGTWAMTGGGPIEWMRANGMPSDVNVQVTDVIMRLTRGGDFIANPTRTDLNATDDIGREWTGLGQSQGQAGYWGAADGVLHFCPLSGEIAATASVDGRTYFKTFFGAGDGVQVTYTCAGDTLTTTMPIPGLSPMDTIYTRTGP